MAAKNFTIGLFEIYQTTAAYKNPGAGFAGRPMNLGLGIDTANNASGCGHCMYAWCCMPCALGSVGQAAFDLPFIMGCCCMNPMNMRNFLRYQYRLKLLSSDCECAEECVLPWFVYGCGSVFALFLPCFWTCICSALYGGLVGVVTQEQAAVQLFSQNQSKQYLVGYNPANAAVTVMMVPQPVIIHSVDQPMMVQSGGNAEMMKASGQPVVAQSGTPSQLPPGVAYSQAVPAYQSK